MFSTAREKSQRVRLFKLLKINKNECKFFQTKLVSKRRFKNNLLENWEFKTRNNEKIPAYFIKPKEKKKYPTIIYCHAHGGNYSLGRDELIKGRKSLISEYASLLCSIGYAVLCLEMPCFGERQTPNESSLTKSLNWYGKTLYGKMISELISGIDFLTKRNDVKKSNIISLGFSMGATHSYWLAALDKRISKCIHICSFADLASLVRNGNHNLHSYYMTVPNLLSEFSTAKIAGLIAPRPQLVCVGLKDKLTDKKSFTISKRELINIYKSLGSKKNLKFIIENNSGHKETPKMREAILSFLNDKN
jgi:cephalosporin-C deacetylase-like acetyl esterase